MFKNLINEYKNKELWLSPIFILAGIISFFLWMASITILDEISAPYMDTIGSLCLSYNFCNSLIFILRFLLPLFICSIFFAIGMYVFKNRSYIFAVKALVGSFAAFSFILLFPIIILIIFSPLLLLYPFLILYAILRIYKEIPDMRLPLIAFISSFFGIFLTMLWFWSRAIFG